MKTPCYATSSSRPGSLLTTGPILARAGHVSFWRSASWRLTVALIMVPAVALRADTSATALHISRPVADIEGRPTFQLSWNASSNAIYLVQSATDLRAADAWKTVEAVTPTGSVGQATIRLTHSDAFSPQGINARASYYRLILPQPQIFSVEPAIVAPGVPVDFFVLGQCFPTNAELRINSLPQSGTLYQSSDTLVQPSFVPDVPGDYLVGSSGKKSATPRYVLVLKVSGG